MSDDDFHLMAEFVGGDRRRPKKTSFFDPASPPTCASEVLSNALTFWGKGGERWVVGKLDNGAKACLYGGLGRGAFGYGAYEDIDDNAETKAFKRAVTLILDELESRGQQRDIVHFNDHHSLHMKKPGQKRFDVIRDVVCCALKRAVAEETEPPPVRP